MSHCNNGITGEEVGSTIDSLIDSVCFEILRAPLCDGAADLTTATNSVVSITNEVVTGLFKSAEELRRHEASFFGAGTTRLAGLWDDFVKFLGNQFIDIDTEVNKLAPKIVSTLEVEIAAIRTPLIIFLVLVIIILLFLLVVVLRLYFPRLFGA